MSTVTRCLGASVLLLAPVAVAQAQWRAEATIAARAAQATRGIVVPQSSAATGPGTGTAIAGAAAWAFAARGPWHAELVGGAGHEGIASRSGGDARAVARLAWSVGGRAGLLAEAGGVLAWRMSATGGPVGSDSLALPGAQRRESMPARVRGGTGTLGGWTRVGRVLLGASARATTVGALRESYMQEHRTFIDSIDVRPRFDSIAQQWTSDTVRLGQIPRLSWTQEERRRPMVLTDVTLDAATSAGAFAFAIAGGVRHAPPAAASEGWATARATFTVREGLGLTLQAARLATNRCARCPRGARCSSASRCAHEERAPPRGAPHGRGDDGATASPCAARIRRAHDARRRAPGARYRGADGRLHRVARRALARDAAGRWELAPMARGVHQVNVRIDGGAWLPPPGLGVGDDGFGGTFGVRCSEAPA